MFKRLSAILLALLVLLASTGFSISTHLCGGEAVSYSLFGCPADCGMGEEVDTNDPCGHPAPPGGYNFKAQKCCSEQTVIIPGIQHVAELVKKSIALLSCIALIDEIFRFSLKPVFASSVKPPFADYHPPARARDLSVLFQVFRI